MQLPLKSRLAERVRETIRTDLLRGRWSKTLPSERHLSAEYGISRPTLHLGLCLLEDDGLIRFRRGQPWEILYKRRKPAQGVQRPEVVVVRNAKLKPDITSFLPLIDMLRHELHRMGLDLVVVDALLQGVENLNRTLLAIEAERRARFYLLLSVPAAVHRWFQARDLRAVILGSRTTDVTLPAIEFDSIVAIQHAIDYLMRRGHRQIGLFIHRLVAVGDAAVTRIFVETCAARKDQGLQGVRQTCVAFPPSVKSAAHKLLARAQMPSAVIATDLELVIGLYATAAGLGIHIPSQLSVVSTAYLPILDYLSPVPTCYQFHWEKMANQAIRIIRDSQRLGEWPNKFCQLLPTLREGESVRKLK